jgi:hypothetical protein
MNTTTTTRRLSMHRTDMFGREGVETFDLNPKSPIGHLFDIATTETYREQS